MAEILRTGTRGTTENFIRERPGSSEMIYTSSRAEQGYEPVAVILEPDDLLVEMRNQLTIGEEVEYMPRGIEVVPVTVTGMRDEEGSPIVKANPGNRIRLTTEPPLASGETNGILRRRKHTTK